MTTERTILDGFKQSLDLIKATNVMLPDLVDYHHSLVIGAMVSAMVILPIEEYLVLKAYSVELFGKIHGMP